MGAAYINNTGQHVARNVGMFAITSATTASVGSIDIALARKRIGLSFQLGLQVADFLGMLTRELLDLIFKIAANRVDLPLVIFA